MTDHQNPERVTVDEAMWRPASARWPQPHAWHDLNLIGDRVALLSRIREALCPADERP